MQYRPFGGQEWLDGVITNVSLSGVLFVGDLPLAPDTPVEMKLTLADGAEARLVCHGQIVRVAGTEAPERPRAMASTIANYQFVRGDAE
jgi:hypothetical protein